MRTAINTYKIAAKYPEEKRPLGGPGRLFHIVMTFGVRFN
jgi:hypothetical protein